MNNGYDLSGALAALEKQGFTPSLIMVERLFRYPDSQSTQNDHLGYWLRLVWERDGMVYELSISRIPQPLRLAAGLRSPRKPRSRHGICR